MRALIKGGNTWVAVAHNDFLQTLCFGLLDYDVILLTYV